MLLTNNRGLEWSLFTIMPAEMHPVGLVKGRATYCILGVDTKTETLVHSHATKYNKPKIYIQKANS